MSSDRERLIRSHYGIADELSELKAASENESLLIQALMMTHTLLAVRLEGLEIEEEKHVVSNIEQFEEFNRVDP